MKECKTIIIGGGISGLACARTLADANEDFLLISDELGGRMLTSKSLTVDYGASYVTSEYKNVLKFVDKGERLKLREIYFIQKELIANIFRLRNLRYFIKLLKVVYLVDDFTRRFAKFRKRCLDKSQKESLKEDKVLELYSKTSALDFIKKHKLEYLHETFFDPVLQSTVFSTADKSNVIYYLGVLIPMVRKTYAADFRHAIHRLTKGYKDNIIQDSVIKIKKNHDHKYLVETKKETYITENVVIATPYNYAKEFYPVGKTGPLVPIYVIHVVGKREEIYQNKHTIFFKPKHHDITILWRQHTGSDIVFSKLEHPDLDKYYKYHTVIKTIYWENSLMLSGSVDNWLEAEPDKNLYLASDYNVCGLEDSFLTGVYAAKKILGEY